MEVGREEERGEGEELEGGLEVGREEERGEGEELEGGLEVGREEERGEREEESQKGKRRKIVTSMYDSSHTRMSSNSHCTLVV